MTTSHSRTYIGDRPAVVARAVGGSTRVRPGDVVEFTDAELPGLDADLWADVAETAAGDDQAAGDGEVPPAGEQVAFGVVLDDLIRPELVDLAAKHDVDHPPAAKAATIRKRLVEADQKEA